MFFTVTGLISFLYVASMLALMSAGRTASKASDDFHELGLRSSGSISEIEEMFKPAASGVKPPGQSWLRIALRSEEMVGMFWVVVQVVWSTPASPDCATIHTNGIRPTKIPVPPRRTYLLSPARSQLKPILGDTEILVRGRFLVSYFPSGLLSVGAKVASATLWLKLSSREGQLGISKRTPAVSLKLLLTLIWS